MTLMCFPQYFAIRSLPSSYYRATGFVLIGFFTAFAGLRGLVGSDTWLYTHMVRSIADGATVALEPGFLALVTIFTSFTDDATVAVNLFSVLFFALAAVYVVRATRTEMIFLFAYFAPLSFIMYSFNGLRIGIASMAVILALQFWHRGKRFVVLALLAFAVSVQHTIVLPIAIFFLFIKPPRRRKNLFQSLAVAFVLGAAVFVLDDYMLEKVEEYSDYQRLSALAGVGYMIKLPLLMAFIWKLPIPMKNIRSKFRLSMGILVAGIVLSLQSYAGLRILNMMEWLIPLLFIYSVGRGDSAGARFHSGLAFVGFVGGLGVLRNIAGSTAGSVESPSPFLPYHFMWQMN